MKKRFNVEEIKQMAEGFYWTSTTKTIPPVGVVQVLKGSTEDHTRIKFKYPQDCTRHNDAWLSLYPDLVFFGPLFPPNFKELP